jgi:hypothetical protein
MVVFTALITALGVTINYAARDESATPPSTTTVAPTTTTTSTLAPTTTIGVTVTTKAPSKPKPRPTTTTTTITMPRLVPGTPDELRAQTGAAMSYAQLKTMKDIDPLYNKIRDRLLELGVLIEIPPIVRADLDAHYKRAGWFGFSVFYDVTIDGVTMCLLTYFPQAGHQYENKPCG